jgi:S1-C subfamily serine protease
MLLLDIAPRKITMKKVLIALLVSLCLIPLCVGEEKEVSPDAAKESSVLVDTGENAGSGVIFKNLFITFVWTDAHVVSCTQVIKKVVDPNTGETKVTVTYKDVYVVKEIVENGRKVGELKLLAKVIRYSEEEDIAVLYVYKKSFGSESVTFSDVTPKAGTAIWHVGSFFGYRGINSVSDGRISFVGRLRTGGKATDTDFPLVYDQMTAVAHPGSSGGGVFLKSNGACVGLVTEFLGASDGLFTHGSFCVTPTRRLRTFAKRVGCEWAMDRNHKVPPLECIMFGKVTDDDIPID